MKPSDHAVEDQLDHAARLCAAQGAQLTELRRSVLGLMLDAHGPLTAYQLMDRLREIRAGVVPPTIYRALDFLIEQRLVHKLEKLNAFIPCCGAGHRHHVQFLICRRCGAVIEIDDSSITQALERAAGRHSFQPGHAVVELDGICAACQAT